MSATLTTKDIAQTNAAAGWRVFPCLHETAEVGGELRKAKAPYVQWPELATTDAERIDKWWRIWPDALVGVALPEGVTVIDLDRHDGRDGIALAADNGWPVVSEVSGVSVSGNGTHLWFAGSSSNGAVVQGYVDRKSAGGYVVTPYELPAQDTITEPLPSAYMRNAVAIVAVNPEALEWLSDGSPSDYVQTWIEALPESLTGDDAVTRYTSELSTMTWAGMSGTRAAFEALESAWDRGEHSSPNPEWPARSMARMLTADCPPWITGDTLEDFGLAPEPSNEPDGEAKPMLRFVTLDELAKRPRPASLIDGYVQAGRMAMLVGEPGIGKSFVALSWSASVACGIPFFGHHARQGTVLYVGAEGADAFGERMAAWERENGVSIPRDGLLFADESMSLNNAESVALTVEAVKYYGASLVVLDTWSQLSGVDDENNAAMVSRALSAAQLIREAGNGDTAVLLVHHTTKSGASYRGSTALLGNVDSMMMMTGSSASFALTNRASDGGKLKDGTPLRENGFSIESSEGGSAFISRGGVDPIQEAVLEILADGEWHPRSDFESEIGTHSVDTLKRRLNSMLNSELIAKEGNAKATRYALAGKVVF